MSVASRASSPGIESSPQPYSGRPTERRAEVTRGTAQLTRHGVGGARGLRTCDDGCRKDHLYPQRVCECSPDCAPTAQSAHAPHLNSFLQTPSRVALIRVPRYGTIPALGNGGGSTWTRFQWRTSDQLSESFGCFRGLALSRSSATDRATPTRSSSPSDIPTACGANDAALLPLAQVPPSPRR